MVGCFSSDLGVNILPKYDGQMCRKHIVNIDVFLRFRIFDLFDILGSSGTAWDLIFEAFRDPETNEIGW